MALRSRSRMSAATSGPGRAPASDGRVRHRRAPRARGPVRHGRHPSAQELRRRAETLFARHDERAELPGEWQKSGKGPPGRAEPVDVGDEGPGGGAAVAGTGAEAAVHATVGGGSRRERLRLALRERMPVWLQTRCGLERRGVLALTVVLVAAAGLAAQHFWTGRTETVRPPEVVGTAAYGGEEGGGKAASTKAVGPGGPGATASPGAPGAPGASGASGAPGGEIVVDVSGKVREPGVHRLPAGSRVEDALRAAGGVRPGTNTDSLNRARFLVDGEQVSVGTAVAGAGAGTGPGGGAGPAGGAAGAAPAAPLSLNTATVEQLDTLPGVGPVLAGHIVSYRTEHGGFRSVDELREVDGIGERRFADLRDLVRP
ncbi:ComEA family DNA-binding protein [Streptomyces sp. NPDC005876]|uniref:ComEA family DNA-binding protein n=1 Tax=Streptomyces sp. NPDC005876 TaxID=3157076 RepID=UPI0033D9F863